MDWIATILSDVRTRLEERVPELEYIDKDRGHLSCEVSPLEWPCALLDVENVDYTQEGGSRQLADVRITVTVVDKSLAQASNPADACRIIDLLGKIHDVLHGFSAGGYAPLSRLNLKRVMADTSYECYRLTYQTAFEEECDTGATSSRVEQVKLELK